MEKRTRVLDIKEKELNHIVFIVSFLVSVIAFFFVMLFLNGSTEDMAVFFIGAGCILVKILEKRLGKYAKYCYISILPIGTAIVIAADHSGRYQADTQCLFLWIMLAAAYGEVSMIIICAVMTVVSYAIGFALFPSAYRNMHPWIVWIYIAIIYSITVIIAILITKKNSHLLEIENQAAAYERQETYFQELQKKDEKYNRMIHDMKHYLRASGPLAQEKNDKAITGILEELNVEIAKNTSIIYTKHRVLNAILLEKKSEAEKCGILFDMYAEPGIRLGTVTDGDLAVIFGNLLDNAIQAVIRMEQEEDKKEIKVRIYMERAGKLCVVKITNPFMGKIAKNKNGFISAKRAGEANGIGIKSVEDTAKKYNGYLECMVEGKVFTAILILPVS